MPMQGAGERTLQVARREIDGAEIGGRKKTVGGEPAEMLREAYIFERSAQARYGVSAPVGAGVRDGVWRQNRRNMISGGVTGNG